MTRGVYIKNTAIVFLIFILICIETLDNIIFLAEQNKTLWYGEFPDEVLYISWDPTGDKLAVVGKFNKLYIISGFKGEKISTIHSMLNKGGRKVIWSRDGRYLAIIGLDRRLYIFDSGGNMLWNSSGWGYLDVTWGPGNRIASSGTRGYSVHVWTGKKLESRCGSGGTEEYPKISYSNTGYEFAIGSRDGLRVTACVDIIWSVGRDAFNWDTHYCTSLSWSPNDKYIAITYKDYTDEINTHLYLVSTETHKILDHKCLSTWYVSKLEWVSEERLIALSPLEGYIWLLGVKNNKIIDIKVITTSSPLNDISIQPKGSLLAVAYDNKVCVWNINEVLNTPSLYLHGQQANVVTMTIENTKTVTHTKTFTYSFTVSSTVLTTKTVVNTITKTKTIYLNFTKTSIEDLFIPTVIAMVFITAGFLLGRLKRG